MSIQQETTWRTFKSRANGSVFRARWEADEQLPGGGAWLLEGRTGYVDPVTAAECWMEVSANAE